MIAVPPGNDRLAVWQVKVGRIPLYLMDTNLPENAPPDRELRPPLRRRPETRIQQEIVLGIGGVRALRRSATTRPCGT